MRPMAWLPFVGGLAASGGQGIGLGGVVAFFLVMLDISSSELGGLFQSGGLLGRPFGQRLGRCGASDRKRGDLFGPLA